jgi:hypothetical protein
MDLFKVKERKLKIKNLFFKNWKFIIKKKLLLQALLKKQISKTNKQLKRKYLVNMTRKFAKRMRDNRIGDMIEKNRTYRFLSLWIESFNTKQDRVSIRLRPLEMSFSALSPKGPLWNFRSGQKTTKDLYFTIKKVYDKYLKQRSLSAWLQFAIRN